MAIGTSVTNQNSGATVNTYVGPSVSDYDGLDGNDVRITFSESVPSYNYGTLNLFLKPHINYNKSTNQYEVYFRLRAYATNTNGSLSFRLSSSDSKISLSRYTSWTNLVSVPGSSVVVGTSSTSTFNPGTGSSGWQFGCSITVYYFSDYTSTQLSRTLTIPSVYVSMSKNKFTWSFDSSPGSGISNHGDVYYGAMIYSPGNPTPPASVNRNITVNFDPGSNSAQSNYPINASLIDTYSFSDWSPSTPRAITGDTVFKASYSLNRSSTKVVIPTFSTSDGKPIRNGYNFNTWKYGSTDVGNNPGSETSIAYGADGGTSYTNNASWTETESTYYIYPTYKDGDEVKEITFKDDDGNTDTRIEFNLKWESSKTVSSIAFKSFLKNGLRVDSSKVYNMRDNSEVTTITGKMADKEYYVLYDIIQDKVTLNLNGGNINGNTANIVIPYNRFSDIISIKSDYKPNKYNTTFVAWYNSATNEYVSEIDPADQEVWPSNIVLTAEYIPIGTFVCRKDKAGKLYWEAIINKWVMHNGQWQGEYDIPGTDIVHTSTSFWILKDEEWKLEYGKQSLPLG